MLGFKKKKRNAENYLKKKFVPVMNSLHTYARITQNADNFL